MGILSIFSPSLPQYLDLNFTVSPGDTIVFEINGVQEGPSEEMIINELKWVSELVHKDHPLTVMTLEIEKTGKEKSVFHMDNFSEKQESYLKVIHKSVLRIIKKLTIV